MRLPNLFAVLVLNVLVGDVLADDWPMYRKDSGRTAVCTSDLPRDLTLRWTRRLPPLTPAFHSPRLHFDLGYEPVSASGMLLVASSQTDSITAYNAITGELSWTFRTNGPVRCAPAIWRDRACFGSDDGHLYCVELRTGKLCWKQRAAPSDRRLLGNGHLISVWPVRGGPVVDDQGCVYFAAGVWPFEGVFVYSMDIATGEVLWRNDRMGYLFGQQPHNTQAIGGLAPQGYLMLDKDELIVPCSTAFPARLNRHDGTLIDFQLPGPGRLPGGWFSQLDTDTARALRRGTIAFDDVVNRQQHEDKEHKAAGGVSGLSRQIRTGETEWNFDNGFHGVEGTIHSIIVADEQVFVVTREGTLSCFAAIPDSKSEVKHWQTTNREIVCAPKSVERARMLVSHAGDEHGIALVLGIESGDLVQALIQHSNYQVVAFDDDAKRVENLRRELQDAGVASARAAVIECEFSTLDLPPYLASVITTERSDWPSLPPVQSMRPFGGIVAMGPNIDLGPAVSHLIETSEPGTFTKESLDGEWIVRRVGPLAGAKQYPGNWSANEDPLVRFPLGVLWFDDTLSHFKRSPQPKFSEDVMISQPKDWHASRTVGNNKIDYPLLPVVLSDIYTGRVLAAAEKPELRATLPESDPAKFEPSQYRPPRQADDWNPGQPVVGQRTNPLTGLEEPRAIPKTYGCDGGMDYGLLYTLRSGTPAYYDKTLESGTVFLSGPRSGCTNSIIPSGGVLNVPYFYEGCTCSYPLPSAMSLVSMPERFEQWSAWGEMKIEPDSIQRIGLNFGAPGDRMTREGTLWLDYPSVGGPSPAINVIQTPGNVNYRYHHSLWMSQEDEQPWVTASMAEGLESLVVQDLKPGKYEVSLYFSEPDHIKAGDRVQSVQLQEVEVLKHFDIFATSRGSMKGVVLQYRDVDIDGTFRLLLKAIKGKTLISGVELIRQEPQNNAERVGAWNLKELHKTPAMRWESQTGPVRSLLYAGEKFDGHPTEVFAFYASPATLGEANANERFPGVVLIHGGGGTAFAEWAWLWAKRGYAAIAMDLSGSRPIDPIYDDSGVPIPNQGSKSDTRTRLPNGGPNHGHAEKFDSIGGDVDDDWPHHAVASVVRAHSLLRSFPEVIADRTAVTGISWGGYTTCLVASVDGRFKAAVPVYGCGFLYEGESVQKPAVDKLDDRREQWIKAYDPSSLLVHCRVPILFVNGTNDIHYPLDSYQKSYDVVPGRKQIRIEVNMRHGHPPGWAPQEIGLFIDTFCRNGTPLPIPGTAVTEDGTIRLSYTSAVPLKSATLHYTTDVGLRSNRAWQSLPAEIVGEEVTAPTPPIDANTWFFALTDERNAMTTTPIQFVR